MRKKTEGRSAMTRWSVVAAVAVVVIALIVPLAAASAQPSGDTVLPGGEITELAAVETPDPKDFDPEETPLLDVSAVNGMIGGVAGIDVLDEADEDLAEAAARNALTITELERVLAADETAHLDRHGRLFFIEPTPDLDALASGDAPAAGPFPYDQTFKLNSKPGSRRTIYLDFNGHTLTGTAWQDPGLPDPFTALPFDLDFNYGHFSNLELDVIQDIWLRVAEDYAPLDVNVTTQDPGYAAINRSRGADQTYGTRVVITDSNLCDCGGIAYLQAFNEIGFFHDYFQPAWCFAWSLSWDTKAIAECVSHEVGHNVGLQHDGIGHLDYYSGHSPWAPIMGVGYYEPVVQWSKGEYSGASNGEDDFVVMGQHGVAVRPDDHGNSTGSATLLRSKATGIISSQSDHDTFVFGAANSGTVTFNVNPAPVSPDLDVVLRLYAANGSTLIASSNPAAKRVSTDVATGLNASITTTVTKGKVYYLQVSGGALRNASTGYTRYGSVGKYGVSVVGMVGAALCNGLAATIEGTNGNEVINGTPGRDIIWAGPGNDTVNGGGGNDVICGGTGNDKLTGGAGNDILLGDAGNDTLNGGTGNDKLWGDAGNDKVNGDAGTDTLRGGTGKDTVSGGSGNDKLWGDAGNDTLNGGAGTDTLRGGAGTDKLNGGAGTDKLWGDAGNDELRGGKGKDTLNGGAGIDKLWGDAGNDTLNGNAGNDQLRGGSGADTLNGGGGADKLWGNAGKDKLNGGGGNDTCNGGGGKDTGSSCEVRSSIP